MPGKLIICRGLPGSGKSTKAKEYVRNEIDSGNIKVMNVDRDSIRIVNGLGLAPGPYESTVTKIRDAMIKEGLRKSFTVIESSCNLRSKYVRDLLELADFYGAEVDVWDFKESTETCITRDAGRGVSGGHSVGAKVILDMYNRFIKDGWPEFPEITKTTIGEPYVPDHTLPTGVVVDIDGTVADNAYRSPYDYSKVITDEPKMHVIVAVAQMEQAGSKIIFMSGRPDSCRVDTAAWLDKWIPFYGWELHMRSADDMQRPDFIVKSELFDKHVRNRFHVLWCVDDRKQVIDMYRDLGLTVFDVAGHTF